jgi:hypothetical protein
MIDNINYARHQAAAEAPIHLPLITYKPLGPQSTHDLSGYGAFKAHTPLSLRSLMTYHD